MLTFLATGAGRASASFAEGERRRAERHESGDRGHTNPGCEHRRLLSDHGSREGLRNQEIDEMGVAVWSSLSSSSPSRSGVLHRHLLSGASRWRDPCPAPARERSRTRTKRVSGCAAGAEARLSDRQEVRRVRRRRPGKPLTRTALRAPSGLLSGHLSNLLSDPRVRLAGAARLPRKTTPVAGREIIVGVSGGSGAQLARRFVEIALASGGPRRSFTSSSRTPLSRSRAARSRREHRRRRRTGSPPSALPKAQRARIVLHDNARRRGLDRLGFLSGLRNDRHPVQRRNARLDRQRNRARPAAARGRRLPEGDGGRSSSRSASRRTRSCTSRTCARRPSPAPIVAPPTPAFYVDSPSVERFLDAYCVRAARLLGLGLAARTSAGRGGNGDRTERLESGAPDEAVSASNPAPARSGPFGRRSRCHQVLAHALRAALRSAGGRPRGGRLAAPPPRSSRSSSRWSARGAPPWRTTASPTAGSTRRTRARPPAPCRRARSRPASSGSSSRASIARLSRRRREPEPR